MSVRVALFVALILALAVPSFRYTVNRQAVVFVADLSSSVAGSRRLVEAFVAQAIDGRQPGDRTGVVVVGREALVDQAVSRDAVFTGFTTVVDSDYTNLEEALRLAGGLLPEDARRRIVLLTDGQENVGDAFEQARFLGTRGVRVDGVPLLGLRSPEVLVTKLNTPSKTRAGERIPVEVSIQSTGSANATLHLMLDGAELADQEVDLWSGENRFAFAALVNTPGFHTLTASIEADADTLDVNNRVVSFVQVEGSPTRLLLVEDREDAGSNLVRIFRATGFEVEVLQASQFPSALDELWPYAAIVLVDVPAESLGNERMELVRTAVRDLGKGLLVVGGGHSFTLGEYRYTPLEDVLPVTSQVPERQIKEQVILVLVIDKSSSMAGFGPDGATKVEMAKEAARSALGELEYYDFGGVVAFDAAAWWLVPIQEIGDPLKLEEMQASVGGLRAQGGTNIYGALARALEGVVNTPAPRKHIVLLTDGQNKAGDFPRLLATMKEQDITLSTIGVGLTADVELLSWLAEEGQGRFHYTDKAADIPRIVTKETRLAARDAFVVEPVSPLIVASSPTLGVTGGEFPTLGGYVVTQPRSAARVVLASPRGDPLLAQWQYGLGRVMAWTSDGQGRWSSAVNRWERGAQFWAALLEWTLPPDEAPFSIKTDSSAGVGGLVVEGDIRDGARMTARVITPGLGVIEVPLKAKAPGEYVGEFPLDGQGAYLVQVSEVSQNGEHRVATGGLVVPYSPEYGDLGGSLESLERLVAAGGGAILSDAEDAFAPNLPPAHGDVPLDRWLLIIAAVMVPLDVAVRRLNFRAGDVAMLISRALRFAPMVDPFGLVRGSSSHQYPSTPPK